MATVRWESEGFARSTTADAREGVKCEEGRTFGRVDAFCREVVEPLEVGVPGNREQRRFIVS